jgi:hypothetical protein
MLKLFTPVTIALVAALSAPAFALESEATLEGVFNWIPLEETLNAHPEVGAYRDIYLHKIEISTVNNRFQMKVTLPEDLSAGAGTVLTIPEADRGYDEFDNFYINFRGPKGHVICYPGDSWMGTKCDVEHLAIPYTNEEREAFTAEKYKGTDREAGMRSISVLSHAEPFGDFNFYEPGSMVEGSSQGNGHWTTEWQLESGTMTTAPVYIDFYRGTINLGDHTLMISGLFYTDSLCEGTWNKGESDDYGWFKINIDGDRFYGSWGRYPETEFPLGSWTGSRSR